MRQTGTLRSWNDDKGFGFIGPTQGGRELFVHISAFPRDGSRPTVGETLSYELGQRQGGKPQAVRVVRQAIGAPRPARTTPGRESKRSNGRRVPLVGIIVAVGLAYYGVTHLQGVSKRSELRNAPALITAPVTERSEPSSPFRCDGRTRCPQMTSCAEATWFINNCPGTEMDGNGDGVPCEQQWCTTPFSN